MQSGSTQATPIETRRNRPPLVALDRGYLTFAGHVIGGAKRFDGRKEPWVIGQRDFEVAFAAGFGKATIAAKKPWHSMVAIVDCLAKGDSIGAQTLIDRFDQDALDSRAHSAIAQTLKPIAKNTNTHPQLSSLHQKFNANHDELGRFASGSGGGGNAGQAAPESSGQDAHAAMSEASAAGPLTSPAGNALASQVATALNMLVTGKSNTQALKFDTALVGTIDTEVTVQDGNHFSAKIDSTLAPLEASGTISSSGGTITISNFSLKNRAWIELATISSAPTVVKLFNATDGTLNYSINAPLVIKGPIPKLSVTRETGTYEIK